MLDYALVAALGMDATAAVRGYRLRVIAEAERRGLRLTSVPVPDVMQCSMQIRLAFLRSDGYADLAGRELRWSPRMAGRYPTPERTSRRATTPVPMPSHWTSCPSLAWATGDINGPAAGHSGRPMGVELDDDPEAIQRLLGFVTPQRRPRVQEVSSPAEHAAASDLTGPARP